MPKGLFPWESENEDFFGFGEGFDPTQMTDEEKKLAMILRPEEEKNAEVSSHYRWFVCPICGLYRWGDPPHGIDTPCPQAVRESQALIEKLEAEKANFLAAGFQQGDMVDMIKKMTNKMIGDDEE